jgi:hypothetical protein
MDYGFGLWIIDHGLWIMNYGLCIWVMDYGLWIMDFILIDPAVGHEYVAAAKLHIT